MALEHLKHSQNRDLEEAVEEELAAHFLAVVEVEEARQTMA